MALRAFVMASLASALAACAPSGRRDGGAQYDAADIDSETSAPEAGPPEAGSAEASPPEASLPEASSPGVPEGCAGDDECPAGRRCDPAFRVCVDACPDGDGDGHRAASCGGTDCDDSDPERYPGNRETCDPGAHDEDCDLSTVGSAPGTDPATCCNLAPDGTRRCGGGCDSRAGGVGGEVCNGLDDNCNGLADEEPSATASCNAIHASSTGTRWECRGGRCTVLSCAAGRADCDGVQENGCEVALASNDSHCGRCENRCGAASACTDGACVSQGVAQVAASRGFSCALSTRGTVACWGSNVDTQRGISNAFTVSPVDLPPVAQLSGYRSLACARTADGRVACWGTDGILGALVPLGTARESVADDPREVPGLRDAVDVSVGSASACAVKADGTVACWGSYGYGALGDGRTANGTTASSPPVAVVGLTNVARVFVSSVQACALRRNGTVACWGNNSTGACGDGTTTRRTTPVEVPGIADATSLAPSRNGTSFCALHRDGGVSCWGATFSSDQAGRLLPSRVPGLANVRALTTGYHDVCALLATGSVTCWPETAYGTGVTLDTLDPIPGLSGVTALLYNSCARTSAGVRCYAPPRVIGTTLPPTAVLPLLSGDFSGPQSQSFIGLDGRVYRWSSTPVDPRTGRALGPGEIVPIPGLDGVTQIALGYSHGCALRANGRVACWGEGVGLGTGLAESSARPRDVPTISDAVELITGDRDTVCVRLRDGRYLCWGNGDYEQLVAGTTLDIRYPTESPRMRGLRNVCVGSGFVCGINASNRVVCWGRNNVGQCGVLPTGGDNVIVDPVTVANVGEVRALYCGSETSCAVQTDGAAYCWGSSVHSRRGVYGSAYTLLPQPIESARGAQSMSFGGPICAANASGEVRCWTEFAPPSATDTVPQTINPVTVVAPGARGLSGSGSHRCFIGDGMRAFCWGANESGQLGDGLTVDHTAPVEVSGL